MSQNLLKPSWLKVTSNGNNNVKDNMLTKWSTWKRLITKRWHHWVIWKTMMVPTWKRLMAKWWQPGVIKPRRLSSSTSFPSIDESCVGRRNHDDIWHLIYYHERHGERFIILHADKALHFSRTWPSRSEKLIWRFIQLDFRTDLFDLICVIMDNFRDCFQSLD